MSRSHVCISLAFLSLVLLGGPLHGGEQDKALATEDERLLESLLRDFLFDPKGAERVRVVVKHQYFEEKRDGWLVKKDSGNRIFFADGESVPAPVGDKLIDVDYLARCKELFGRKPDPAILELERINFDVPPEHRIEHSALVHAAWLYRLGKTELAVQAMAYVQRDRKAAVASLRRCLAQTALNRMIHCYGAYRDEETLDEGSRLLRLYPAEASDLPQAALLVKDLQRRKQQGKLGKKVSTELPGDYATWDRKKQLVHLIESLADTGEQAPILQRGGPPPVEALVAMGDYAIPALLDVLEKDERMTRRIVNAGKWQSIARVVSVREVAFNVVCRILRVIQLDPRDPKADDLLFGPPDPKKASREAREYWKEFGPLSFEARMMRVLCDPRSSFPALREAAKNLAGEVKPDDSSWPSMVKDAEPNPAVLKFKNPTAAEAIIKAMDRDLAHDDSLPQTEHNRASHEPVYFSALIRLGDRRIAPVLGERASRETNVLMRVYWAHASHRLGHSQPLRDFAKQFAAGKVTLAIEEGIPSRWQLERIVEHLAAANLPEADSALARLAEPGHRYHEDLKNGLIDRWVVGDSTGDFLNHPYCVGVLRRLLDDRTVTRVSLAIREPAWGVSYTGGGCSGEYKMPAVLADPSKRKASADVRRCDLAGEWCRLFAGLPQYHPLLKDSEERLAALKKAMDGFTGKYRILTPAERIAVAGNTWEIRYGPDITPLGRPATAEDVKAFKAVFHLDGKGRVADMELPARGAWKIAGKEKPRHCLIVQAEVRADGEVICGVIEHDRMRTATAREFAEITSLRNVKLEDDE